MGMMHGCKPVDASHEPVVPQAASLPYRRLPVGKSKNACSRFIAPVQFKLIQQDSKPASKEETTP
jgi:hypothetical protein